MRGLVISALTFAALAPAGRAAPAAEAEELAVLDQVDRPLLYQYLLGEVERQYALRDEAVKQALTSADALTARRERLRADLRELVGELPERTPLNAKTLGTIQCDGYVIEKVIFESRPRHHVTANLYLPDDTSKPVPGVLVPCGHNADAKAYGPYQSASALLAANGIAALIYDPIGQGERFQILDLKSHGTNEHTLVGLGALAVGLNTAHFRIWDGLRAMDYLAGRPEVDPRRLGCTGNSGGGTMTTWLMAVDERIVAAAPACFITTVERLFNTIGPQDCEQHFPGQGRRGIDHTDFITMRAPKPTLILAAEKDFFDFGGTREAYAQAQEVYRVLSHPERVGLSSDDAEHGFGQPLREAAVRWMRTWLADDDRPVREPALKLHAVADLRVTSSGQVVKEFADEVTVVDIVNRRARELAERREPAWQAMDDDGRRATIRRALGLPAETNLEVTTKRLGEIAREDCTIEKLLVERAGRVPLPALLCVPQRTADSAKLPAVIYADGRGKAAELRPGGHVETLVGGGRIVLSVDLGGYGETADQPTGAKYGNSEFRTAMVAMHVGRPLVGQRVEDLLAALAVLCDDPRVDAGAIHLVGVERAGPVALHAAALEPRFATVALRSSIGSWTDDVVARPIEPELMGHVVPSALEHYDLPDLAAMLGNRLSAEEAE